LTNDDGIDAPGLAALVDVARRFGEPVVVAPHVCHSAKSHAISMRAEVRVEPRPAVGGAAAFACSGTPADCVRIGLLQLDLGPIDLVLSGINPGGNAGVDVYYSGTVAAAREAAILGRTGVAVSQLVVEGGTPPWPVSAARAADALRHILARSAPGGLFSVNLPAVPPGGERGLRACPLSVEPWPMEFDARRELDGKIVSEYRGRYVQRQTRPGSDFHALVGGWITITPLRLDHTDSDALQRLAEA
jgi:5'-nucleotidase